MPIYQYDCDTCRRRVDVFFRSVSKVGTPVCPECGGKRLKRVVSTFARARSERERLDSIDLDQEMGRLESGDVGGFERWARRMGRQYDGELGAEFSEMADKAAAGEDPIERVDPAFTLRSRVERRRGELDASAGSGPDAPAGGPGGGS
jgi:putative FmdB family regulatory protein